MVVDSKGNKAGILPFRLPNPARRFSDASKENDIPIKDRPARQKKGEAVPILKNLRKLTPIFTKCFANRTPYDDDDICTEDDERITDLVSRALADEADCSHHIISGQGPSRVERWWHEGLASTFPEKVAESELD